MEVTMDRREFLSGAGSVVAATALPTVPEALSADFEPVKELIKVGW